MERPENAKVYSKIAYVRCCRVWPIVEETTTVSKRGIKKELWWWRSCGLCNEYPRLIQGEEP